MRWGRAVRLCLALGRSRGTEFCHFCRIVYRAWCVLVLHRNPVFYGFQPKRENYDE